MADVQPALPETSQLPADLSVHEAADLLASYRNPPQQLGQGSTDTAESVIEETPEQDQPVEEPESSEEGSLEESTEETEEEPESLADSEDDQPEESEADAEFYEIDGEEIPLSTIKEWRESGMRQDDYQRKTQVLAQQMESVGGIEKKLNQFAHASAQQYKGRLSKIEGALKQYSNVDWPKLAADDQQKFAVHQAQFDQLKNQYAAEQRQFNGFLQEFNTLSQQATEQRAEAAYPEIKQRIKGWNQGRYHELREFLTAKLGANADQVNQITDPWFWELANDAFTYRSGKTLKTGKQKIRRPTKTLKAKAATAKPDPKVASEKKGFDAIINAGSPTRQMDAAAALMKQRRGQRR